MGTHGPTSLSVLVIWIIRLNCHLIPLWPLTVQCSWCNLAIYGTIILATLVSLATLATLVSLVLLVTVVLR